MSDWSYDSITLDILEDTLRDVWQVLKAHAPYPDWNTDPELKKQLAEKLMALADSGIRDPQELRKRMLRCMNLALPN